LVILPLAAIIGVLNNKFYIPIIAALLIIALFSNITAWQRLFFVYQVEKQRKEKL